MPSADGTGLFDQGAYERANDDFVSLQHHLPRDAVVNLAREVVERLGRERRLSNPGDQDDPDGIEELCEALVARDSEAGLRCITRLRNAGVGVEELYRTHLPAAARRLGALWESNTASFTDVTIGAGRIYAILRLLRGEMSQGVIRERCVLAFASVPGEQHTLGVTMAADMFRNDGWDVELLLGLPQELLIDQLEKSDYALVGLSASCVKSFSTLAQLVVSLRVCNPSMSILISGTIVEQAHDVVALTGADGVCWDLDSARREVERLTRPRS